MGPPMRRVKGKMVVWFEAMPRVGALLNSDPRAASEVSQLGYVRCKPVG